jgi:transcriptional regulatory protein LEU3
VAASPYEKYSRHSSETNNSIPNTPSIARPLDGSAPFNFQHPNVDGPQPEPKVVIPDYALVCEDKHLDAVALPAATIRELFVEYVENYHPILPVVDVMKGPERIYKLCPALFWVIMFVSLRRFHDDSEKTLLIQLSPLVKGVLAEIMISPITRYNPTEEDEPILNGLSAYAVQAFLLYSFWPPITSSLSADSSYSTVGNAFYQAIRIGLHSPGPLFSADISHKTPQQLAMAQENAKTWIVCNCVSQAIATSFGFPAFVQFDSSIWTLFRPGSILQIPKSIQFMMEIAYFEDQVAKTLNSNPMDTYGLVAATERLPLLKLLTRRLDELEVRMAHELPNDDGFRKFQLLSSRVHLLTYHFMDATLVAEFELQRGLVQLYNAAIALISHTQLFQTRNRKFVKHLPGVYILNIWQAACIIGKLTHSSLKRVLDTGSGKQTYEAAISLAAKASILKHDVAHRASGIMKNMWQLFRTLDDKKMTTLTISIRTRMSASVFFDCMYLLRDQVGMIKLNNRTDSKTADNREGNDEDAASYDEEDYGFNNNEEAIVSDNEDNPMGPPSQKSTPGSSTSSGRKGRSLSNTVNAESKARKIIRTIPLDPQPIAVGGSGKRSTIFKVVNASSDSSPSVRGADKETPPSANTSQKYLQSPEATKYSLQPHNRSTHNHQRTMALPDYQNSHINGLSAPNGQDTAADAAATGAGAQVMPSIFNDSPHASLENIDFDLNGEVLWNDVESVMNDFGFNI